MAYCGCVVSSHSSEPAGQCIIMLAVWRPGSVAWLGRLDDSCLQGSRRTSRVPHGSLTAPVVDWGVKIPPTVVLNVMVTSAINHRLMPAHTAAANC